MVKKYDFLIIGGGVAGMSFALKVARSGKYNIALCCKTTLEEANTAKAQGGIASVFGNGGCGKGHKEWVKVADGGPYLKTKARLG